MSSPGASTARERARARLWAATPVQTEIGVAISTLLGDGRLARDRAIEASVTTLAELTEDAVMAHLLAPGRDWTYPLAAHHPEAPAQATLAAIGGLAFRVAEGFTATVLESGQAVLIPAIGAAEIRALQPDVAPVCEALGVRGLGVAPLSVRGTCIGFLWQLRTRAGAPLDEADRRFLQEIAARLALAIEAWRLDEALEAGGAGVGDAWYRHAADVALAERERAGRPPRGSDEDS